MHTECFEHFGCGSKPNGLALLPNSECGQINRNYPILAERQAVVRMTRHLQNELAIPPFVDHLVFRRLPDGEPAKHKRPGGESKVLLSRLPFQLYQAASFCLTKLLL